MLTLLALFACTGSGDTDPSDTDSSGELHFVKDGDQEVRKIQKMMGGLRVLQGDRTWLEFERIE